MNSTEAKFAIMWGAERERAFIKWPVKEKGVLRMNFVSTISEEETYPALQKMAAEYHEHLSIDGIHHFSEEEFFERAIDIMYAIYVCSKYFLNKTFVAKHRSGSTPRNSKVTVTEISFTGKYYSEDGIIMLLASDGYGYNAEEFDATFDIEGRRDLTYEISDAGELFLRRKGIKTTDRLLQYLAVHCKVYKFKNPDIVDFYPSVEAFYASWEEQFATPREEAEKRLHGDDGEFSILPENLGVVWFTVM